MRHYQASAIFVISLLACISIYAAENEEPLTFRKIFTSAQASDLKFCIALVDTTRAMAEMKLEGKTQADVINYYAKGGVSDEVIKSFAAKVFSENSTPIWDYTITQMKECSIELAKIPADGVNAAQFCMQQVLTTQVAHNFKRDGKSIEGAYEFFADREKRLNEFGKRELREAIISGFNWSGDKAGLVRQISEPCIDRHSF